MKAATIALVVRYPRGQTPELLDVLSDDREISVLESEVGAGDADPLQKVYEYRTHQAQEDNEFGDYVEDLLSQPCVKPEIQQHGVQWLKSKIRIEQFQKNEAEAAKIIAEYALKVFAADQKRIDFMLAGPKAQVRVRIFVIAQAVMSNAA
ncbi:hypothetical protein WDW37_13625 [Bdellovibrionota bacterium FG-1]